MVLCVYNAQRSVLLPEGKHWAPPGFTNCLFVPITLHIWQRCWISWNISKSGSNIMLPFEEKQTTCQTYNQVMFLSLIQRCRQLVALTISPITWLSLCSVRFNPKIPNTTKTIAPVLTRGRTAGRLHLPPLQGLKPNVLDTLRLEAEETSVEDTEIFLLPASIYTL